jgi:hypothetical protein
MVEFVKRVNLLLAVLLGLAVLHLSAPRVSWGCGCCACDLPGGDVECGVGDTDCGLCIALGGVPAASCGNVCGAGCTSGILCSGDPQECSTDAVGGCCASGSEFASGCFVMTAAACDGLSGVYRGDGSNCDAPCTTAAPAPALTPWGLLVAAFLLVGIGTFALRHGVHRR